MADGDPRTDEELLAATRRSPDAFAVFYRRHAHAILGFYVNRLRDSELAADLTAEVFAAALIGSRKFKGGDATPRTWLFAIAHHKLADSIRRGRVEDRARRKLGMQPLLLEDEDLLRIDEIASGQRGAVEALEELPEEVRAALRARVIDERDYSDIARELRCSEQVVRQRVSRGLRGLRTRLERAE